MNHQHKIQYEQVLELVKLLSPNEMKKLVSEVEREISNKRKTNQPNEFQKFLLTGPTWTDEEYEDVCRVREQVNKLTLR
jgi:hypothetical protein